MDLSAAERLTASADPKAIAALQQQSDNPAVAKAVAGQFGTLLMQRLMQDADGEALGMADGIGGNIVNQMFAGTMSQAAMSGDQLGLADLLFRSMAAKQSAASGAAGGAAAGAAGGAAEAAAASNAGSPAQNPPGASAQSAGNATAASVSAAKAPSGAGAPTGFALTPYWQSNGLRPLGSSNGAGHAVGNTPVGPGRVFALPARNIALAPPPVKAPPGATAAAPAQPGSNSGAVAQSAPAEVTDFSRQMVPLLQSAAQTLGVSPKTLLAHAALETGWGRSVVGNNIFGIKAGGSWSGAKVVAPTHEVENGVSVPQLAAFRAYPSLGAAVQDYVSLISERYHNAQGMGEDARKYGEALIAGGYATDPDYPSKLQTVAASAQMAAVFAGAKPALPAPSMQPIPLTPPAATMRPIRLVNW